MKTRILHIVLPALLAAVPIQRLEAEAPAAPAAAAMFAPYGETAPEATAEPADGSAAKPAREIPAQQAAEPKKPKPAPETPHTGTEEAEESAGRPETAGPEAATTPDAATPPDASPEMDIESEPVTVSPQGMRLKRRFLPTSRRIDREINKNRFVFKGETMCGLTVSYGTLSTDEADMFPVFENVNLSGNITTVNPFVGYFYKDNQCIGVRFGYTHLSGKLNSLGINLGEQNDLDIDIPWLDLSSDRFSFGLFHRSYVALDEKGRFGAFGEFEISLSTGENTFSYESGDTYKYTASDNTTVKVWFNPGVAVYAFPNVCATLSFGLGGFKYTHIKQYNEAGDPIGSRKYSKMNFRLNIADIKIGMIVHLWNKKKGNRT